MPYQDLYKLGYTPVFNVTGREEITEDISLANNPMTTTGSLSGTVTSDGSGVQGATVKVYDVNDNPVEHTNTGGNGQFTIANLPVGSYKVTAIKNGYLLSLTIPITIQNLKTTTVTITIIEDPDANLSVVYGIIRTTVGELPLENAVVNLYHNTKPEPTLMTTTYTNDHGQFIFGLIPPGEYYVSASKIGYYSNQSSMIDVASKEFIPSDISLFLDNLSNTGTISGFIKEQSTGLPIADAGVALYEIDNKVEKVIDTTRTNSSGKYLFTNVQQGTYIVKSTKQEEVI